MKRGKRRRPLRKMKIETLEATFNLLISAERSQKKNKKYSSNELLIAAHIFCDIDREMLYIHTKATVCFNKIKKLFYLFLALRLNQFFPREYKSNKRA